MDRYTIEVDGQTFVVDVEALDADRFGISVDGRSFNVTLGGHPAHASAWAPAPAAPVAAPAAAAKVAASAPAPRQAARGGGAHSLNAPMPGVILEVSVSAGDTVERGQQVAVLEAMKMNNAIRSPRAGVISEVCVETGQAVGHGDAIVRFTEG